MINKAPIFVNGFTRGGTNLLMNLIVSHPDVCMLGGEMHVVFYGRDRDNIRKWGHRLLYLPILFTTRQHFFWPYRLYNRNKIPRLLMHYIDFLLYCSKVLAPRNRIRGQATTNTIRQIVESRLVSKNVNGVVLTTPLFAEMYPDAIFIGLVRNGLALAEGFIRRGWTAERIGKMYEIICQQMIKDEKNNDNYFLVRFEDLIEDPVKEIANIYSCMGLDIKKVSKYRLQAKKSMTSNGTRDYSFGGETDREIKWFKPTDLHKGIRRDVNQNQIARLEDREKFTFLRLASKSMSDLNYI